MKTITDFIEQRSSIGENIDEHFMAIRSKTLCILPYEIVPIGFEKRVPIKSKCASEEAFERVGTGEDGNAFQSNLFLSVDTF
jgi:hypothetical protein